MENGQSVFTNPQVVQSKFFLALMIKGRVKKIKSDNYHCKGERGQRGLIFTFYFFAANILNGAAVI